MFVMSTNEKICNHLVFIPHRHPYPTKSAHYTYRFQVPDSDSYDVSWTNFCTEKLESYNWNYVDHYICSRGEEEFGLLEVRET